MTDEPIITINDLPVTFKVKFIGSNPAKGLWGMKHTRKPVDLLVERAKNLPYGEILPMVNLTIDTNGITYTDITSKESTDSQKFTVDMISYGVQDFVYTRVFSMIIVLGDDLNNGIPFRCYSFLCESKQQARQVTYALSAAFLDYGNQLKNKHGGDVIKAKKRFAIDLRTPEEQANAGDDETEA